MQRLYMVPNVIWPKRAILFVLQALAGHPSLIEAVDRYNGLREADVQGLPPRY